MLTNYYMKNKLKTYLCSRLMQAKKLHPSSTFNVSEVLKQVEYTDDTYVVYEKNRDSLESNNLQEDTKGIYYTDLDRLPQKIYIAQNKKELKERVSKQASAPRIILCETQHADQVVYQLTGLVLQKE